MVLALLRSCIPIGQKKIRKRSGRQGCPAGASRRCILERLEDRTVPSVFAFAVEGDSLSTPYTGYRASLGDKSWVQLLSLDRPGQVDIHDFAQDGATSTSLLSGGQPNQVANLVKQGIVHYATLEIGGNDEQQFMTQIIAGNYQPFVTTVVSNIEKALQIVQSAGPVQQVLGLLPNIGFTPKVKAALGNNPLFLSRLATAVNLANQQLLTYASAHHIVCVNFVGLGQLTQQPFITLAGTSTHDYWSPDNFHPSSVMQGLSSNAMMLAFHLGYGVANVNLRLTDQEILNADPDAGKPAIQTATYFNVQPYVIMPASTTLVATAPLATTAGATTTTTSTAAPAPSSTTDIATSASAPLLIAPTGTVLSSSVTVLAGAAPTPMLLNQSGSLGGPATFSAPLLEQPQAEDGFWFALGV
jgi:lysophospholipase L1-like esterase